MASKDLNKQGVYSAYVGDNGLLIENVIKLYAKPGYLVADVTYGKGVFWGNIDTSQYDFHKSDLLTCPETPFDFRHLPYEDGVFDVVVFDPPYAHNPGKMLVDKNYRNAETTSGMYHKDIIQLYADGMKETTRILKVGGTLWVKGMDEVESGFNRWSHIEQLQIATNFGLYGKDLFVLVQKANPVIQHKTQQHARKKQSYLWIFKKPVSSEMRSLYRYGILPEP